MRRDAEGQKQNATRRSSNSCKTFISFIHTHTHVTHARLNDCVGAFGSSAKSLAAISITASLGTLVKKKDPPKSAKSNNEMAAVPTGPTFPPSAVSNPGTISSGAS